nr:MAG TPA: hypothetical protein [Caudoviricetes sp.]DAZ38419.1 MAG TPA: hypothetical protein [Caudoviricetes sp.]
MLPTSTGSKAPQTDKSKAPLRPFIVSYWDHGCNHKKEEHHEASKWDRNCGQTIR